MEKEDARVINSGLTGFLLLDAVTESSETNIRGVRSFVDALPWLCVESLAQLGALHVRLLNNFNKHAFLLKMNRCLIVPGRDVLDGLYLLKGSLVSRSSRAFSYDLEAWKGNDLEFAGNFLYAVVDYDDRFKKDELKDRYIRIYQCLKKAGGKSFCKEEKPGFSEHLP